MGDESVKVIGESNVSGGLQTHIPKAVAMYFELKKNDRLVWTVENDKIVVRKKK